VVPMLVVKPVSGPRHALLHQTFLEPTVPKPLEKARIETPVYRGLPTWLGMLILLRLLA
jgi:hypothetical protein